MTAKRFSEIDVSPLVELREVTKLFSGVTALSEVTLTIEAGEVLALVGENGAGKSTLMKILSGVYPHGSFTGSILLNGRAQTFRAPRDAEAAGIAIIHQELSSFLDLSVAENLFVGRWPTVGGIAWVDWRTLNAEARHWLKQVGLDVDPETPMRELSVGACQLVEIAKALARDGSVIILDEPTSALSEQEVETLFRLLRELRERGKAIVYISHKMDEIYALSTRITVLRDGHTVHTEATKTLERDRLVAHMVGREIHNLYPELPARTLGENVCEARNFSGWSPAGKRLFGPLNLALQRGEILGLAGLLGSGRSELLRAISGDSSIQTEGEFYFRPSTSPAPNPQAAIREGIFYVSEDRKGESILPGRDLVENAGVARLIKGSLFQLLRNSKESQAAEGELSRLRTKYATLDQDIATLSGGNQQKVILARALAADPHVILLDEPTRGVDVGAKYEIYEILFTLAQAGKALIVVSSELPELMALADRILVLSHGRKTGELARKDFSQTAIMRLAVGQGGDEECSRT